MYPPVINFQIVKQAKCLLFFAVEQIEDLLIFGIKREDISKNNFRYCGYEIFRYIRNDWEYSVA